MSAGIRLAAALAKLADRAHEPVLYLQKNKTAELQYASAFRASRGKETERSRHIDKQDLSFIEITACEVSDGLRKEICQWSYQGITANQKGQAVLGNNVL